MMVSRGGDMLMVVIMMSPEEVNMTVAAFPGKPGLKHPEPDGQDKDCREKTQPAMQAGFGIGAGENFCQDA